MKTRTISMFYMNNGLEILYST